MPLLVNPPLRIVDEASMMQCVFWLAFDQTPLFADHEDLRVYMLPSVYPKSSYDSDEAYRIIVAREELLLHLNAGSITATGVGYPEFDDRGLLISKRIEIEPVQWRSMISERDWGDNTLRSFKNDNPITFISVYVRTADLFM